jgi:hypothetical protein
LGGKTLRVFGSLRGSNPFCSASESLPRRFSAPTTEIAPEERPLESAPDSRLIRSVFVTPPPSHKEAPPIIFWSTRAGPEGRRASFPLQGGVGISASVQNGKETALRSLDRRDADNPRSILSSFRIREKIISGLLCAMTDANGGVTIVGGLWSDHAPPRRLPHTSPLICWNVPVSGSADIMRAQRFWLRNDRTARQAWQPSAAG